MMCVNEGVNTRDVQCCPLCSREGTLLHADLRDRLFGAPGNWQLIRCPACEVVWLNPQPVPEDIGKLYAQYFTHQNPGIPKKKALAYFRKIVKASILQFSLGYRTDGSNRILGSALCLVGPLRALVDGSVKWIEFVDGGRLLDVGCGNGGFLDQMRQLGWEVAGVEPDEEAVSVARERFDLEVFNGSLEEARFPDGYFDAITMSHLIEHVIDPAGLLKECRRVMKPGGKLVMTTPNIKSHGHRVFGEHWRGLEVPRHLHIFSLRSLRVCAEHAGLEIRELRTSARSASWMWAASSLIRREGALPGGSPAARGWRSRLQGLAFMAAEHGLRGPGEAGEEIVMVATR